MSPETTPTTAEAILAEAEALLAEVADLRRRFLAARAPLPTTAPAPGGHGLTLGDVLGQ